MGDLNKLVDRLRNAKSVLVFTGAGISKESGLPTYRGEDGLWETFNPFLVTKKAYADNPKESWGWYQKIKEKIGYAEPNKAHMAVAELEKLYSKFLVFTQNVDGLHQKAGSKNVLEIHGNMNELKCLKENKVINKGEEIEKEGVLYCECGSILRPNVVWFGEEINKPLLDKAWNFIYSGVDVCLTVGTTCFVYPAAEIPIMAHFKGAYSVDINTKSVQSKKHLDDRLEGSAVDILPKIIEEIKNGK